MKINDKVVLNEGIELKVFYYNEDPDFLDHDLVATVDGSLFDVVGYVPEMSNNIRTSEEAGDFDNYFYVIKNPLTHELFRVERELMKEKFSKVE